MKYLPILSAGKTEIIQQIYELFSESELKLPHCIVTFIFSFQFSHKICVWKFYIIPIITFSTVFNVPKFFELSVIQTNMSLTVKVFCIHHKDLFTMFFFQDSENSSLRYLEDEYEDNQTVWRVHPTDLRLDPDYVKYYLIYSNFIINSLLPFAILIILNYFICKRVSQSLLKNNNTDIKLM